MNWMWASLMVATCIKWTILKYGGVRSYRKAIPFFTGLILGEFAVGSVWGIVGALAGIQTYAFKNW